MVDDDVDSNDILFTLLRGVQSRGLEMPLQNLDGIEDTLAKETGVSRRNLNPLLVKCGLLSRKSKTEYTKFKTNRSGIEIFRNDSPELPILVNFNARRLPGMDSPRSSKFTAIKIGIPKNNSSVERASKRRKVALIRKRLKTYKRHLKVFERQFQKETDAFRENEKKVEAVTDAVNQTKLKKKMKL